MFAIIIGMLGKLWLPFNLFRAFFVARQTGSLLGLLFPVVGSLMGMGGWWAWESKQQEGYVQLDKDCRAMKNTVIGQTPEMMKLCEETREKLFYTPWQRALNDVGSTLWAIPRAVAGLWESFYGNFFMVVLCITLLMLTLVVLRPFFRDYCAKRKKKDKDKFLKQQLELLQRIQQPGGVGMPRLLDFPKIKEVREE
jgi:hypothetical protein